MAVGDLAVRVLGPMLSGFLMAFWPSVTMWSPVLRERTPDVLVNMYFSVGLMLFGLFLFTFADGSMQFNLDICLSGVMVASGSCLLFVAIRYVGYFTAMNLMLGASLISRCLWDLLYLESAAKSPPYVFAALLLQLLNLVLLMRNHMMQFRVGPATIVLDMFGVEEKSVVMLQGTSVHELKLCLWKYFWEQSIDLGKLDGIDLQLLDGEMRFVNLRTVRQLRAGFEDVTIRIVESGDTAPSAKGMGKHSSIVDYVAPVARGSKEKVAQAASDNEYGTLLAEDEEAFEQAGSVLDRPSSDLEDWDEHDTAHALEIGRRLKSAEWKAHAKLLRLSRRAVKVVTMMEGIAIIAGFLLASAEVPLLFNSSLDLKELFRDYPVMALSALIVAPALPMHNSCASCASYHLSRQCNTMPTLPHACSVVGIGLGAGVCWMLASTSVVAMSKDSTTFIFVCFGAGALFSWVLGMFTFKNFERDAMWRTLGLAIVTFLCGLILSNFGPEADMVDRR